MATGPISLGAAVISLLVFVLIGGPAILVDWLRKRRAEEVRRQIALTDAIDSELGSIVAPVVSKPLWGPWRVHIAVPFARPMAVGRILRVAHEVFTIGDGMGPEHYEIVVTPKQGFGGEGREGGTSQSMVRWPRDSKAAA